MIVGAFQTTLTFQEETNSHFPNVNSDDAKGLAEDTEACPIAALIAADLTDVAMEVGEGDASASLSSCKLLLMRFFWTFEPKYGLQMSETRSTNDSHGIS